MSVCAVSMVLDEVDVIVPFVEHTLAQVDQMIVSDNGSTDGTREILDGLARHSDGHLVVQDDPEVGYYQSRKMTALADQARDLGHSWVVPCDADEVWVPNTKVKGDGRSIREYVAGIGREVQYLTAALYNHLPTGLDDQTVNNPFARITYRQSSPAPLGKVACKLRPGLVIHQGNHSAWAPGAGLSAPGLVVRHFSWRSEGQYLKKIRNGQRAYAATDLDESAGAHWRMHGDPDADGFDDRVRAHFWEWFYARDPDVDDTLVQDPAPLG